MGAVGGDQVLEKGKTLAGLLYFRKAQKRGKLKGAVQECIGVKAAAQEWLEAMLGQCGFCATEEERTNMYRVHKTNVHYFLEGLEVSPQHKRFLQF